MRNCGLNQKFRRQSVYHVMELVISWAMEKICQPLESREGKICSGMGMLWIQCSIDDSVRGHEYVKLGQSVCLLLRKLVASFGKSYQVSLRENGTSPV